MPVTVVQPGFVNGGGGAKRGSEATEQGGGRGVPLSHGRESFEKFWKILQPGFVNGGGGGQSEGAKRRNGGGCGSLEGFPLPCDGREVFIVENLCILGPVA